MVTPHQKSQKKFVCLILSKSSLNNRDTSTLVLFSPQMCPENKKVTQIYTPDQHNVLFLPLERG